MTKNSTKKIPRLRFKGFEGEWEEKRLGDVAEFFKGKGYSKKDLLNNGSPIILYGSMYVNYKTSINDYPNTFVKGKESKDVLSKKGDVIVPASGETSTDIARASNIKLDGIILGGDLNIVRPNKILDSLFLAIDISTGDRHIGLSKLAQGNSIVHLHNSDLKSLLLFIPSISEQQKIGSFFAKLDQLIDLQSKKVEQLKKLKRGYLQKLFPQKGESVPRLRFDGFSDEWEKIHLGSLLSEFSNKSKFNNEYPLLSSTNNGMEKRIGRTSSSNNKGYKIIKNEDLVLSPQNLWLGNININNIGIGIVSPSYKTFKIINIDKSFIKPILKSNYMMYKYKMSSVQGASIVRRNLDMDLFNNIIIFTPNNNEQQSIGSFFNKIDNLIYFSNSNLSYLNKLKKSYLQKVFC
ncbi:restriction endonuclease subunit S [Apilactobacillus micheneri]|uniref:restriction endonuclease subunit S n=1 Tax=Apilactobacillus micheneri TaxID=1899430 RepID=UPI000D51D16D|nr:restriction endonuclease subunit S [Apilactobacillus micheneri]GAY80035.1 hypothetical protein NBRC113063_00900 [Apilactobacillus micheneri]